MSGVREAFQISVKAELNQRGIVLLRDAKSSKRPTTRLPKEAMEDSREPQRSEDFVVVHKRSLQLLQQRLDAIKEDLNEEIQVAIGAVQVDDAQIMKEQTKETIRQTRVTVALAVLAAIYLPLTLVTGIFGMNIAEISDENTVPHAWSVIVAWVAVVALTVGGFLIWKILKY
jgi:Mg2+ and Co2+ transporter CorA